MREILPGLTKKEANDVLAEIWNKFVSLKKRTYEKELNLRTFTDTSTSKLFRWSQSTNDGDGPESGRSLWIIMYGGDTPSNEEDIKLNEEGSIWLIPRCSTDWQQEFIDRMLDRIIEHHIIVSEVNSNRIFLIGISSSGGDGVYQLAPRMADRWAAAGVMDGNPNNVSPLPLRNLPFALFMSGQKNSENNKLAARTWAQSLEECSKDHFSGGYHYSMKISNSEGQRQDALTWMNKYTRNPWPNRIIWYHQGCALQKRFYWLTLPFPEQIKKGQTIIVEVRNRKNIYLEQIPEDVKALIIRLSDTLVNLNQPVTINVNKETKMMKIFHGIVPRTRTAIEQSIEERADPMSAATALLHVIWVSLFFLLNARTNNLPNILIGFKCIDNVMPFTSK